VNDVLSFMLCVEINMFYCCDVNWCYYVVRAAVNSICTMNI
jgi:hypothetical protein